MAGHGQADAEGASATAAAAPAVAVRDVAQRFGSRTIYRHVSCQVAHGEIFVILGGSGCGKSTLMKQMIGLLPPSEGRVEVLGRDMYRERRDVLREIGVMFQSGALFGSMTLLENVMLPLEIYTDLPRAGREEVARVKLGLVGLAEAAELRPAEISGGMAKRAGIARALSLDPPLLFLDEPSAGLDPQTRLLLWEIIRDYNRAGKTIVLTTHYMDEADSLCERLAIIDHGKIIAQGTPQELKSSIPGGYLLRLRFDRVPEELATALKGLPGVSEVRAKDGGGLDLYADRGGPLIAGIVTAAQSAGVDLCDVHIAEPSLETLFLHHTGRSLRD